MSGNLRRPEGPGGVCPGTCHALIALGLGVNVPHPGLPDGQRREQGHGQTVPAGEVPTHTRSLSDVCQIFEATGQLSAAFRFSCQQEKYPREQHLSPMCVKFLKPPDNALPPFDSAES